MNLDLLIWTTGLIFSAIAGIIAWQKQPQQQALLTGLLVALMVCVLTAATASYALVLADQEKWEATIPTVRDYDWNQVVHDIAAFDQDVRAGSLGRFGPVVNEPIQRNIRASIRRVNEGRLELTTRIATIDFARKLIAAARDSVLYTSYINPSEWWETTAGSDYQKQGNPGVVQRRIFIVDSEEELQSLSVIMDAQSNLGVDVRYVFSSDLPGELRRDFIVVDGFIVGEMTLEDRQFVEAHIFFTGEVAADYLHRFGLLSKESRPIVTSVSN